MLINSKSNVSIVVTLSLTERTPSKWSRKFETQFYFPLKKLVRLQVPGSRAPQAGRQASGLFRFPQHHEGNERHEKQVWKLSPKLFIVFDLVDRVRLSENWRYHP